jgi:hypothetical protein
MRLTKSAARATGARGSSFSQLVSGITTSPSSRACPKLFVGSGNLRHLSMLAGSACVGHLNNAVISTAPCILARAPPEQGTAFARWMVEHPVIRRLAVELEDRLAGGARSWNLIRPPLSRVRRCSSCHIVALA